MKKLTCFLVGFLTLFASCSKHFDDFKDASIIETDEKSGLFTFKTVDNLFGVANSDGEIIVDPEYKSIVLSPPFIFAHLSDEIYNKEIDEMAKKAGADKEPKDADEAREIMENYAKQEHEYIIPGYSNSYYCVFNSDGKRIKDFALGANLHHIPQMGDTAFYTIQNCREKTIELINKDGKSTPIENYYFTDKKTFGYRDNEGNLQMNINGKWHLLWGAPVGSYNGMIILQGDRSDPKKQVFDIVDSNANLIYLDGWDIVRWIENDDTGGIFVKALEGEEIKGEKRSFWSRPMAIFYIDKNGKLNKNLP
ncbi:MAG: hypothetical protein ACI4V5_03905, partial [Prevotella sp.]